MIILYGSCAMGTNIVESDLDLFIVGSEREQIVDAIAHFSPRKHYGYAEIKPVITNSTGWAKLETGDPLFFNELQRGVMLFEKRIDESRL
jgi:predicted nucleotidyltransferase